MFKKNPYYKKHIHIIYKGCRQSLRCMNYRVRSKKIKYHQLDKYNLLDLHPWRQLLEYMTSYDFCNNKYDRSNIINKYPKSQTEFTYLFATKLNERKLYGFNRMFFIHWYVHNSKVIEMNLPFICELSE